MKHLNIPTIFHKNEHKSLFYSMKLDQTPLIAFYDGLKVAYINDSGVESIGYNHDELMQMEQETLIRLFHPNSRNIPNQIRQKELINSQSAHMITKDGRDINIELSFTHLKIKDIDGQSISINKPLTIMRFV